MWRRGIAPQHVRIRSVGQAARDGCVNAAAELVEAFGGALAMDELAVARVGIRQEQTSGISVRARNENRGHAANIGGQPRGGELFDEFAKWHNDLAAQMPAILFPSK